ncbi:MAG TPA: hypothetical protein VF736_12465 [Pyrinomonadaceae bacterium]|jgi:hypothetical protein
MKPPRPSLWVVLAAVLSASATVAAVGLWHSSATTGEKASDGRRQYVARMHGGLSEVEFAAHGSPPGVVRAEVNSLARVIRTRSGADLSQAAKDKLEALEGRTLRGEARPAARTATCTLRRSTSSWTSEPSSGRCN